MKFNYFTITLVLVMLMSLGFASANGCESEEDIFSGKTITPPTIDGAFGDDEWNFATVHEYEYDGHIVYIYTMNDGANLYVLLDVVSDNTEDEGDYGFIETCFEGFWIDTEGPSCECGCEPGIDWDAEWGFGTSPNSDSDHRIYEFAIPFWCLTNMDLTDTEEEGIYFSAIGGDGTLEIEWTYPGSYNFLYMAQYTDEIFNSVIEEGKGELPFPFGHVTDIEISDLDDDGLNEVIFTTIVDGTGPGGVWILENNGNNKYELVWSSFEYLEESIDFISVATGSDFNNNGYNDFAAGTIEEYAGGLLFIFEHTGIDNEYNISDVLGAYGNVNDITIGNNIDNDEDPYLEIILAVSGEPPVTIHVIEWVEDAYADVWDSGDPLSYLGVATGDTDGDGIQEIIGVTELLEITSYVAICENVGNNDYLCDYPPEMECGEDYMGVQVADTDEDGTEEIITGTYGLATVYVYEFDGEGYATTWDSTEDGFLDGIPISSVFVADPDSDGHKEILAASSDTGFVFSVENDADDSYYLNWIKDMTWGPFNENPLAIAASYNLDQDCFSEIIIGSFADFGETLFILEETPLGNVAIEDVDNKSHIDFVGEEHGMSLDIEIDTNPAVNGILIVSESGENPTGTEFSIPGIGYFFSIDADFEDDITQVYIKVYYDENQLGDVDEEDLRIYHLDENSEEWVAYESPDGGVDTDDNYVWARSSHLSFFGAGETETGTPGGGSARVSKNYYDIDLETLTTKNLTKRKDYLRFTYKNESHKVSIYKIVDKTVTFRIASDVSYLDVKEGETAHVDIDGDNIKDITLIVNTVYDISDATITIKKYAETAEAEEEALIVEDEEAPIVEDEESPAEEEKVSARNMAWLWVIIGIVIVIAVVLIINATRKSGKKWP